MYAPGLRLFVDDLHDQFGRWPLAYTSAGGPELAEVLAIGERVAKGDDVAFAGAFRQAGEVNVARAAEAESAGHRHTASDLYLRASALFGTALHPLYGAPVDPLLLQIFERQSEAFARGLELLRVPAIPLAIPCDGVTLPGYLIPAQHATPGTVRPLIIFANGYDATMPDVYFASAVAATRRGYHALLFDGPGQGAVLYQQGVPMRPDWETVVSAVIDVVEQLPTVDPRRIVISGWSLGGYLSPRAASGEHRLAACIADPGQWDLGASVASFARALGAPPAQVADLSLLSEEFLEGMQQVIDADRRLRWSIVQRGFWVNGVDTLRDFIQVTRRYSLVGREADIRCPTLITLAEADPLAASAEALFDQLTCEKTLMRFTDTDAAAEHCEMGNRSLLNLRVLDWLDDLFARATGK